MEVGKVYETAKDEIQLSEFHCEIRLECEKEKVLCGILKDWSSLPSWNWKAEKLWGTINDMQKERELCVHYIIEIDN